MSSSRFSRGIINSLMIVGVGVILWMCTTPTEEEMRKRLKGTAPGRSESEQVYGQQKQNKIIFDAIKKSAGITDKDSKKK